MQFLQTLNVLIAGEGKLLPLVKSSKFLKKLYATSDVEGAVNVKFNTFAELAKKWGITQRRVAIYCKEGRLNGAVLKGRTWLVPGNVEKPDDPRKARKLDK